MINLTLTLTPNLPRQSPAPISRADLTPLSHPPLLPPTLAPHSRPPLSPPTLAPHSRPALSPPHTLSQVHVRYEELSADADSPCAIGVVLGRLRIAEVKDGLLEDASCKLEVQLGSLGAYVHTVAMGATPTLARGHR